VLLPMQCKEIEFLRGHAGIKRISFRKLTQPVGEFWREYDANRAAKAIPAGPPGPPLPPGPQGPPPQNP